MKTYIGQDYCMTYRELIKILNAIDEKYLDNKVKIEFGFDRDMIFFMKAVDEDGCLII